MSSQLENIDITRIDVDAGFNPRGQIDADGLQLPDDLRKKARRR